MFFGETELRKWIALATLARTAEDKPSELIRHSLVRARFCESVARLAKNGLEQSAFLTGLFSLLDALIDRPLEETLSAMRLAPEIAAVLSGKSAGKRSAWRRSIELARAYEVADWRRVEEIAPQLRIAHRQSRRSVLRGSRLGATGFGTGNGCPAGIAEWLHEERARRRPAPRPKRLWLKRAKDPRRCGSHWRRLAGPSRANAFSKRSRKPSGIAVPPLSTMGSGRVDLGRLRELEKACFMPCTSDWIISS